MKDVFERDGFEIDPEHLEWTGVALAKRIYALSKEHGLRSRVRAPFYRNQRQWTELVGGDMALSSPFGWQQKFQAIWIGPASWIHIPVVPETVAARETVEDFRRTCEPDGMMPAEFNDLMSSARRRSSSSAPIKRSTSSSATPSRPSLDSDGRALPEPTRPAHHHSCRRGLRKDEDATLAIGKNHSRCSTSFGYSSSARCSTLSLGTSGNQSSRHGA